MFELTGKRILIVEDNVMNMAVYAVMLKQKGVTVIQDFWSTDTISLLLSSMPIDAILLDLMLNDHISGYNIFDRLQEIPDVAGIPVIAVSAADPTIEMPKARAKGFAGFIGKPVHATKFPRQIAACIGGEQVLYAQQSTLEDLL